jgi:hypothetical protein
VFEVVLNQNGEDYELKGSIFRFPGNEGARYASEADAAAALLKAKPFMKAKSFKAAKVQPS